MLRFIALHPVVPRPISPEWASAVREQLRGHVRKGCFAIALGTWYVPVQAGVLVSPPAAEVPMDRSSVQDVSPRMVTSEESQREKLVEALRDTAQSDSRVPGKPRPPKSRQGSAMAPADAAWLLGLLALHGLAMPADLPQAQLWFERAQMLGHPLASAGLAWCQLAGCVNAPNPAVAMHWIARVRRTDLGLAKLLEWHAAKALAPLPKLAPSSPDRSRSSEGLAPAPSGASLERLLVEASRAGNAQAGNELGLEYLAQGHLNEALAQFQSSAPRSEAAAANANLLASRINSNSAKRPKSARYSAADWYAEARRYHIGDGVPANYAEAVRLYQIAASAGHPDAKRMLSLIFSRPAPDGTIDIAWMQQLATIETGPSGVPQGAGLVMPKGWQRDPSPLYDWVPPEWRNAAVRKPVQR